MNLAGLIDGHFHFKFDGNVDEQHKMLNQAFSDGMLYAVEASTSTANFKQRIELQQQYPSLLLTAGAHPAVLEEADFDSSLLPSQIKAPQIVAVGEIGLDYSYTIAPAAQQKLFAHQLELAKKQQLPVMLHVRDAHDDALAMIKEQGITDGVVHCFTGDETTARCWLNQNFYLSFSGIVTFKNAMALQQSATYAPGDRLLCETDAPFLAPVPHRGKENQVGYVSYVYDFMAKLRACKTDELAKQVAQNFSRLYRL